MTQQGKRKGPMFHRFLVGLFTILLGAFIFWLLGFVVADIGQQPGPTRADLEGEFLDRNLVGRQKVLTEQIAETERKTKEERDRQQLFREGSENASKTLGQMLDLHRLKIDRQQEISVADQQAMTQAQALFLDNQRKYQEVVDRISALNTDLVTRGQELRDVTKRLAPKNEALGEELIKRNERHDFWMATWKLAVLVPLLLVAGALFMWQRGTIYAPLVYAFGAALVVQVLLVMHTSFPSEVFRYILIGLMILIALRILVYLLRMVAFPKTDWLLKQYREAYEAFLCPVCNYPIRRGPLRFLTWTRRSIRKLVVPPAAPGEGDQPYSCPSCGTELYEKCSACGATRHTLLPSCQACGATKGEDEVVTAAGDVEEAS